MYKETHCKSKVSHAHDFQFNSWFHKSRSKLCFGNITEFMLICSWPLTQNSDYLNSHISYCTISYTFQQKNSWYISVTILLLNWATDRVKRGATDGHLFNFTEYDSQTKAPESRMSLTSKEHHNIYFPWQS